MVDRRIGRGILMSLFHVFALLPTGNCDQLPTFGLSSGSTIDPCTEGECECYDWEKLRDSQLENRFTVNCTGMKFGFLQGMNIPKNLPFNTTDLIVSEYFLGTLGLSSFPNELMFLRISLQNCHINYLSADTFQSNSFVAVRDVSLSNNYLTVLREKSFQHLPYIEMISMDGNFLHKVEKAAFRNLPRVQSINLSHNCISEIDNSAFDNLPNLEVLDLSYNWMKGLPGENILWHVPSLKVLVLDGNFWNCSCEMTWVLGMNQSLLARAHGVCRDPVSLNGTALDQLSVKNFQHCFITDDGSVVLPLIYTMIPVCIVSLLVFFGYCNNVSSQNNKNMTHIGQIEINLSNNLGLGVFRGRLRDGRNAAIKRVPRVSVERSLQELNILLHLSEKGSPHPNVVRYLCVENDPLFTYIALELCEGDIHQAICANNETITPYLKPQHCLLQIAQGLKYIHDLDVQHRDIKPHNILWKLSRMNSKKIRFLISDFDRGHFSEEPSAHKSKFGTKGWTACELWLSNDKPQRTKAVDIFSLGCVFFFVLTVGSHPFGIISNMELCQSSINDGDYSLNELSAHCSDYVAALAQDLIKTMISKNSLNRPEIDDILAHPLLWDIQKTKDFYHQIGNILEGKKTESEMKLRDMLEYGNKAVVFEGSWMEGLDSAVRNDVSGFKKEKNNVCGLLRVIRNKIEHFGHLGEVLRHIYFDSKEGVVHYYNQHFPQLLAYTFHTEQQWVKECTKL